MNTPFYIDSLTGTLYQNKPDADRMIVVRNNHLEIIEKTDTGETITKNDKELKLYFESDWNVYPNIFLKEMVNIVFNTYLSGGRVEFFDNLDSDVIPIDSDSDESWFYHDDSGEIQKIFLQKDQTNLLVLVHEIIHACIYQFGNPNNHTNDYLEIRCNNLLVFNENPGFLLDLNTALRMNFESATLFEPMGHNIIFPEGDLIYNRDVLNKCEENEDSNARLNNYTNRGFFAKISNFISTWFVRRRRNIFLKNKFGSEYDFFSNINGFPKDKMSKRKYISQNVKAINNRRSKLGDIKDHK